MKKQVIEYANKHNIVIAISYVYMYKRKIEAVNFYTPDGYQFDEEVIQDLKDGTLATRTDKLWTGTLHYRCYPDWWLEDGNASEKWKFIYNNMCSNPPTKCPADCVCKEVA